jgi:hypothetical protein
MSARAPVTGAAIGFALLLAALLYLLPTLVAVGRDAVAKTQVVVLNVALGWTGAGWICAFVMAFGPRTPRPPVPPPTRPLPRPPAQDVYQDGVYLASAGHDTHTWVIREAGRWRVVYEVGGDERLVGEVPEADVPLSVLATALTPSELLR